MAIRSRPGSQPNPALLLRTTIPFIHSSPGWTCLCAVQADHLLWDRGQPAACEGVFVCACPSIIISGCNSIVITIYFILSQISHPFRSSVWLEVRSEVLGGQGFYSLFPPQSAPRVWDGLAELGSCQELAWQLSWTRGEKKKGKKLSPGSSTSSRQKSFAVKKNSNSIPNHSIQTPGTDRRYSLSSFVLRMLHLPPSQSSGNSSLSRSQSGNWFDASPFF